MTKFKSKKNDSYKSESTNEEPVQESNSKPVEKVNNTVENTDNPIDWKRFDHIYCINYYKNNDRLNHIMSEFHRLSITDNFSVERIYPSVLDVDNYNVDKDKFFELLKKFNMQDFLNKFIKNTINVFKETFFNIKYNFSFKI